MKFSIIIPAYNSAGYIRKALDSVKAQSFKDYELIVVCDSCDDDTEQIAKEYGAVTEAVNFHADGLTRNRGIELARGDWVLFMDDDDWWLHEFVFQQIADMAGRHGEDILLFSFIWKNREYFEPTPTHTSVAVWSKCWRREFIGDTRFPKVDWNTDGRFHRKIWAKGPKCYYWNMPMYYYNFLRPGSQTWEMQRKVLSGGGKL